MRVFATFLVLSLLLPVSRSWAANGQQWEIPKNRNTCAAVLLRNSTLKRVVKETVLLALSAQGEGRVPAVAQALTDLIVRYEFEEMDFAFFERLFRDEDVPVHLIAAPKRGFGYYLSVPPDVERILGKRRLSHRLIIVPLAEGEAFLLRSNLRVTEEENLENLRSAGFVISIDDTQN